MRNGCIGCEDVVLRKVKSSKIFVGADHGGFLLKEGLKKSFEVEDVSPRLILGDDYPLVAQLLGKKVVRENSFGVLVCTSGIGMSIAANKVRGVRAALCRSVEDARRARADNDANICCLGGADTSVMKARRIVQVFLETSFLGTLKSGKRHLRREKEIE